MIPAGAQIVGDYLRSHGAVAAITGEVVSKTPDTTSQPWVRIHQLDAANARNLPVDHLITFFLQLDCYAGADNDIDEAELLARTVRAALDDMPNFSHAAVVSSVKFTGMPRLPDEDFEPARERYVLDAMVVMHR